MPQVQQNECGLQPLGYDFQSSGRARTFSVASSAAGMFFSDFFGEWDFFRNLLTYSAITRNRAGILSSASSWPQRVQN